MNRQSNFKHSSFVTHAAPAVYNLLSFSSRKSRNVARKLQFCKFRCAEHFRCCRQHHDDFYELRPPVSSINLHCFCNASVLLSHTEPSLLPRVYSAVFLLSIRIQYKIIIVMASIAMRRSEQRRRENISVKFFHNAMYSTKRVIINARPPSGPALGGWGPPEPGLWCPPNIQYIAFNIYYLYKQKC